MSGWIKLEKDRRDDPRVMRMARELRHASVTHERFTANAQVTLVLGCLDVLWCYADAHIREDDTLDLGVDEIDELVGLQGFCNLMPSDWLEVLDANSVKLPDFQAHNGTESKRKALSQKRSERYRNAPALQPATLASRTTVTRASPDQTKTRLDQTKTNGIHTVATLPADIDFESFKTAYPKRNGSNPWPKALSAIHARIAEGVPWQQIIEGAERYSAWCKATGKLNTEHVMQAARFCGPGREFLLAWDLPASRADTRLAGNLDAAADFMQRTEASP
jgi:hypothetical protein